MTDRRQPMSDDQLDSLLTAAGDRIDYPAMTDPAASARARIEQRATTAQHPGFPDDVIPLPGRETTPIPPPAPPEPERLGREQTSRLREFALLGGGLAAAAIVALVLALVFRGFDDASDDDPAPTFADSPLAAEPFDIPGYEFVRSIGQPQVPNSPADVAVGTDGIYYIADAGLGRVVALDEDGELVEDWGDQGVSEPLDGGIGGYGLAIKPDGNLLVLGSTFYELNAEGMIVDEFPLLAPGGPDQGSTIGGTYTGPAIDAAGNVYFGHSGSDVVWRMARDGDLIIIELNEDGLVGPVSDPGGNIFVMTYAGRILQIQPDGQIELIRQLEDMGDIIDLAVDEQAFNVLVADRDAPETDAFIARMDRDGGAPEVWDTGVPMASNLRELAPALNSTPSGDLLLADRANGRLLRFSPSGELLDTVEQDEPGAFHRLWRIALDGDGNVYAIDPAGSPRVHVIDNDGAPVRRFDIFQGDDSPGQVNAPPAGLANIFPDLHGLAVADDGTAFTGDSEGSSIRVFDDDGSLIDEWGEFGLGKGEGLLSPTVLTTDGDDSLFISDDNGQLREFRFDGEFIGSHGDAAARDLWYHDGAVWAVESESVLRFPIDGSGGEVIARSSIAEEEPGEIPGELRSLAVTTDDNILIYSVDTISFDQLEFGQSPYVPMLSMISVDGSLLWTQSLEPAPNRYIDLAVSDDGTLYLSDSHLRQILVYRPTDEAQTPESTATVEAVPQNIASDLLVVERAADAGGPPQFGIYEPVPSDIIDLPIGELVGISPDHKILLMIDREPGEAWMRLELIAVSTETFEELWRTDIGALNQNRPNTIYYDTTVIGDTAYVAMHDPDFRREMLEVAEVHLADGALISVSGLDTNLLELGQPGIDVDLLASPESSYPTVLITNTNSGELLTIGRERFTIFGDLALPNGTPRLLPGDKGLFIIPPTGMEAHPAILYLTFDDMALGEIALPFAALADSSGSFTEYAVANDGRTLYAVSLNSSQVAIVDLERIEVEQIVELDNEPIYSLTGDMEWTTLTPFYADHPIAFSPDGRYMYCLGYPRDHPGSRPGQGLVTYTPPVWKIDTTTWEIVNDWAPEAPWLAHAVQSSDDRSQLYVSLGMLAEVDDPDAQFRLTTENLGFAVLSTDALDDQTGYVDLQGYQLVGTLADVYRETHGISPG